MNITDIEQRIIEIEMAITHQDKVLEELNEIVFKQGRIIDVLVRQNEYLLTQLENNVKPLSEETPPPHY